jgi:hypothetical protein
MQGMLMVNGNARVGLYRLIPEITKGGKSANVAIKKQIVAHLVVPAGAIGGIAKWLAQQEQELLPKKPSGAADGAA